METACDHQLFLSPAFSLYGDEGKKSIYVSYGVELKEVVPDDSEHMAFKMMVGRLYNAKVRVATLENVFDVNRKTIRSWGHAILSRDANELECVLPGRGVSRKRTPAIDKYVRRRWAQLQSEGCVDYRAAFLGFLQERWPMFIRQTDGGRRLQEEPPGQLRYRGPALLPFGHDDVRIFIDNVFEDGLLQPIEWSWNDAIAERWIRVGLKGAGKENTQPELRN